MEAKLNTLNTGQETIKIKQETLDTHQDAGLSLRPGKKQTCKQTDTGDK